MMMWPQHRHRTLLTALILILGSDFNSLIPPSHAAEEECAANDDRRRECTTAPVEDDTAQHHDNDYFYAWSSFDQRSLMKALFPDTARLQSAWETHPLLSRVSFAKSQLVEPRSDQKIPTSLHDRSSISQLSLQHDDQSNDRSIDPILSLFSVDDIPTILSTSQTQIQTRTLLTHGIDYKLVKKIILPSGHPNAGEEYNGMLPKPHYSIAEVQQHFHYGGFSLVINKMQQRWKSVANVARRIEEELGVMGVGVNLYLTPEVLVERKDDGGVRQGFESHWDWMDVIVIQLSGMKRWSVAREPSIHLSNKDQKRKPSNKELGELQRYEEFTLCPGDVLYIPRGHIHNASTVIFDNLNADTSGNELDLDNCPSYPKELASSELFADRLNGPSLHLTFGLLQSNDATMESLLHFAMDAYFAQNAGENVAIPANTCSSPTQRAMNYDLQWKSILHHSLAEVARRKHPCDGILSEQGSIATSGSEEPRRCDGTVVLRQSVPLLLLDNNNNFKDGIDDIAKDTRQQRSNLEQSYLLALGVFQSSASIPKTVDFIQTHLLKAPEDSELIFHYPSYSQEDVILCPDAIRGLSRVPLFRQLLQSFDEFAKENFQEVLRDMNLWARGRRDENRYSISS